ncbi:MAG: outer membrane protein assembly factor BamD [Bacteroidota bacterium]
MVNTTIRCAILVAFLLSGCSSSEEATTLSADERFQRAKALYDDEDYLEAINEFTIITLQYQGSAHADDAQYFLGESRFARGEYLLAAFEYQQLKRSMTASPLIPDAQFKIGLCYFYLSPPSMLDQQYTLKAIDELQSFVEYYPSHDSASSAEGRIKELSTRLAAKSYEIAQQYAILEYYKSALFYYDDVIEKYHDTDFAPLSYFGKAEALMSRKRYDEARTVITTFIERFPNSVLRDRADKLKVAIEEDLRSLPPVSSQRSQ